MNELTAGRKLDTIIAVNVMGWTDARRCLARWDFLGTDPLTEEKDQSIPLYSIDIAAAWQVAEWLRRQWSGDFTLQCFDYFDQGRKWRCKDADDNFARHVGPLADTAPLAICLAALQYVPPEPNIRAFYLSSP